MNTLKQTARKSGILYLLMGITGAYGLMYVPAQLVIEGDLTTTATNIINEQWLYNSGIIGQLICQVIFIYLVLELSKLFKAVDAGLTKQMITLVIVSIPIAFLTVVFQGGGLFILTDLQGAFTKEESESLFNLFFKLWENGINVVQVFWGLWLIPFGLLVNKSKFMPRVIGLLLIIGGIGYVIASFSYFMIPTYAKTIATYSTIPSALGEFSAIFYLLIKGVNEKGLGQPINS